MLSEDIFLEFRIQELAPPVSLHCSGQQAPGEDNIDAFEAQSWWSNRATVQHFEGMAQHTRDNRDGGDESERRMQKKALFPQNRSILFFKKKIETGLTNRVYKFDRRDGDGTSGDLRRAMVSTEEANGFDLDAKAH
jgi:hypothetical protein